MAAALLDNTVFAGVMRRFKPDLPTHRQFLRNYPDHENVDRRSFADFLTALCIFDRIVLEASSRDLKQDSTAKGSWAGEMLSMLPVEVSSQIDSVDLTGDGRVIDDEQSMILAYDLLSSKGSEKIVLDRRQIPKVYYSAAYVFRSEFENINQRNGNRLSDDRLAQAMFLHRGLYLQSRALLRSYVYVPYEYRGKMLSAVSPLVSIPAPCDGLRTARIPLATDTRPHEDEYSRKLNEFYYSLLEKVCWVNYDSSIPFIGVAIAAKSNWKADDAISRALVLRQDEKFRKPWDTLRDALAKGDRATYEVTLKDFENQITAAAASMGADVPSSGSIQILWKLATFWLPKADIVADAVARLLPENVRQWGRTAGNQLLTKTANQMLFIEHAQALQGISSR